MQIPALLNSNTANSNISMARVLIMTWLLALAFSAQAAITGQWDFNLGNLAATIGVALQYRGDTAIQTQFGTTTSFGIPNINGQAASVMKVPATSSSQGYVMFHGAQPNSGGDKVNRYTLVMDVLFPSAGGFRALWQTETNLPTTTDGDLFVNAANGVGISGQYDGNLTPGVWHRVAFTVDLANRELGKYVDGSNVLSGPVGAPPLGTNAVQYLDSTSGTVDGRWALDPTALLFADDDGETEVVYVNSIQFHDRVLTPAKIAALGGPSAAGIPFLISSTLDQWDLNGSLASSVGGSNLVVGAAAPASGSGISFTNMLINGQNAQVAAFTRGTFFRATHGLGGNGGGSFLNVYTLIMDVMFPSRPTGWAALWQTNPNNSDDGDWFINPNRGLGISGNYGGTVADGTWNRLALVVDNLNGTFTSFLNGTQVQQNVGLALDGRWSLGGTGLLFADENQENAAGFVNSIQLRPEALSAADLAALGGPSVGGIPVPSPPTLRLTYPNGGENFQAGSTQDVVWVAINPSGLLQIDLFRGETFFRALAQVNMRQSNYTWIIHPRLGDTNNYRIKLTSISFPAVEDFSDAPFSVFGSAPPANPLFGQELQRNGGFELLLTDWQTVAGHPLTLTSADGKGVPHCGARFFHGGVNPAGDAILRQEIDLDGFTPQELDSGSSLDAQAWLRNWFGAGTFDDQVYYRVAYLNASGQELASLRCMVAANSAWVPRSLTGLLPAGTRKLRLEIQGKQRRDLDNDSMADDFAVRLQEATAPFSPAITKLPMLQDVRPDAMTLLWETDGNLARHFVDWGRSNILENTLGQIETLQIDGTHFVHRATLTGLQVETRYVYRVRSGASNSATFSFRTAPKKETPFAVAWWGDNHDGTVTLRTHVSNLLAHGVDLIAVAGDMVNNGNVLGEWHNYWFKPLEHLNCAQTTPVIFARGNHDGEHALAYAYSALPGNESWFAFDYSNCRFIFLDSEVDTAGSPEQFAWLQTELWQTETQQAAFRIVCFHRPPYANLWNGGGYIGETFVRDDWVPLFEQGHVDLVVSGHAHNYNRGSSNGVTYVVSGGGGGFLDVERVANWPLYTVEYSRYHYDLMEVNGDTLSWQTFDNNNALLDMFTLKSRVPSLNLQASAPPDGNLRVILSGKPGVSYVLEDSTNLTSWKSMLTNTLPANGPSRSTNSIPVHASQQFFRARVSP